jgi:O-succinylbenzoic acid--CoA ligase
MTQNIVLPDWLVRCAENRPGHLAVQCEGICWSFAELDRQVTHLARQLATLGVREGSRVVFLAGNGLPYVALVYALTRLRAILVPLNVRLTQDELCWQIQDAQATILISDTLYVEQSKEIMRAFPHLTYGLVEMQGNNVSLQALPESEITLHTEVDLDAIQAIMYTSGTTGRPKGAIITYGMQWWNATGSALNLGHDPSDCWLACMPFFHIGGLSILMRSVIYGISVLVQQKFDAQAVNDAIVHEGVTIISVVAQMLQRMLTALDANQQDKRYPETLRCVLLGGGPAPQPLLEACEQRGIPVVQTYGLTEACSQSVTLAPQDALRKLGSAGRPLPPVQLRILHEGKPAASNEPGEIYLKGPTITPGYAGRPEETARAFQNGWLATGDIGYLDTEGYLYVLDRRSDLIISGGENVYPAEIEAILLAHPAVEEAGVCGQPDAQWGQVPIAFVRLRSGNATSTEELIAYAAEHLARYKQPKAVYVVEQLPRNSSGKLLRRALHRLTS